MSSPERRMKSELGTPMDETRRSGGDGRGVLAALYTSSRRGRMGFIDTRFSQPRTVRLTDPHGSAAGSATDAMNGADIRPIHHVESTEAVAPAAIHCATATQLFNFRLVTTR